VATVPLTDALKAEYQRLFDTCALLPRREAEIEGVLARLRGGEARYQAVAVATGVPWHVIGVIHQMECGGRFDRHLHNGDPLTARTVRVPAGRPATGTPPFTWEASAEDALRFQRLDRWNDWSLPATLYRLEGYNGWGYRLYHPETLSPYLWGGSNHYTRGEIRPGRALVRHRRLETDRRRGAAAAHGRNRPTRPRHCAAPGHGGSRSWRTAAALFPRQRTALWAGTARLSQHSTQYLPESGRQTRPAHLGGIQAGDRPLPGGGPAARIRHKGWPPGIRV